jgi:valyl-tRNA synthetase
MKRELNKAYEPGQVEQKWYGKWEADGLFNANADDPGRPFSIVIPPPNITGSLHIGHAFNCTIQDVLIRYKKACGFNALWLPGTDHAGIVTQYVVEKRLAARNISRKEIGREKFIEEVWNWRAESGGTIINQLKRLGCACDWRRERFTMDEGLSNAVKKVFVTLDREGLIYRGDYIINWCPRCLTALSDLEVEPEDSTGSLYHIAYPLEDKSGEIIVATTRPETMLGDTAVAVNPEDPRYSGMKGKNVILPLMNTPIPIIMDPYVTMDFGTGALKITPGHDFNDFEIGKKHGLKAISIFDENGNLNENAGQYKGMERFESRKRILADLEALGLLKKVEPYKYKIGHCYRCRTIVEPTVSKQWFVATKTLAEPAIKAVRNKDTEIIPSMWEASYFHWMENIRDWCISRQLWWGHRIPAWYCKCGEIIVDIEEPKSCTKCGGTELEQESDVLDTWFSSGLWPFSTLGWPEDKKDVKVFYPTSVLVTSFDILFFWVARMMMLGLKMMGEVPFKHVYIHALVRDAHGQKMSKSKGNVVDPLVMMEKYGTDAFRFTLAAFAAQGRDIKLAEERIEGNRHFVNKIWNASRFVLMNIDESDSLPSLSGIKPSQLEDKWILTRLSRTVEEVRRAIETYHFDEAAGVLYRFTWNEFCDWYIEMAKLRLTSGYEEEKREVRGVLLFVLENVLRLLHPFMPFVTEEIRTFIPGATGSIMKAPYPEPVSVPRFPAEEEEMATVIEVIKGIRNVRGENRVSPAMEIPAVIKADGSATTLLERNRGHLLKQARLKSLEITGGKVDASGSACQVVGNIEIFIPLKGLVDAAAEIKRIDKELANLEAELGRAQKKLSNESFVKNAPPEVVQTEKDRLSEVGFKKGKLLESLKNFKKLL